MNYVVIDKNGNALPGQLTAHQVPDGLASLNVFYRKQAPFTVGRVVPVDPKTLDDLTMPPMQKLRECMGFVENGSAQSVTLYQDDATKDYCVRVQIHATRSNHYHGKTLDEAIDAAYEGEK